MRFFPIVAILPATFVGVLKFGVELAYGHSVWLSAKIALVFFGFVYLSFVAIASAAIVVGLRRKARQAGVSL
jgi:hypothetical protein